MLSLEKIEDFLSCPIHLGLLNDARELPCGHFCCLECFERFLESCTANQLNCPMCRRPWFVPMNGARGLPESRVVNNLICLIKEEKLPTVSFVPSRKCGNFGLKQSPVYEKIYIIKSLAEDIGRKNSAGYSIHNALLITELNKILQKLQEPSDTDLRDNFNSQSSLELKMETETTQKQISQKCKYQINPENLPFEILKEFVYSSCKNCVDLHDTTSQSRKLVFVNLTQNVVIYHYNSETRTSFVPKYGNNNLKIVYLRLSESFIFVSALIYPTDGSPNIGVLLKYDLDGNLLNKSAEFENKNKEFLPVFGFDIDMDGNIYLAHPDIGAITAMTSDFKENDERYIFTELRPNFVCFSQSTKELWLSCPDQKAIVVLDSVTGKYFKFQTSELSNTLPSHIISTKDNKVYFLDSKSSGVFMIKKYNDYVSVHPLSLKTSLTPARFIAIRGFCNSFFLLLISDKFVCVGTPLINHEQISRQSCSIL